MLKGIVSLEQDLVKTITQGDETGHAALLARFQSWYQEFQEQRCDLNSQEKTELLATTRRIQAFCNVLVRWEEDLAPMRERLISEADSLLSRYQHQRLDDPDKAQSLSEPCSVGTPTNASAMRVWFVKHAAHPFPSLEDKEKLVAATAASTDSTVGPLTKEQITLWFINARRRSGWTAWTRRWAAGNRAQIRSIIEAINAETGNPSEHKTGPSRLQHILAAHSQADHGRPQEDLASVCRHEYECIVQWLEQGANQRVGDWMDKVVAETKALRSSRKKRKAGGKIIDETPASPHLSKRNRTGQPSTIDSDADDSDHEPSAKQRRVSRPKRRIVSDSSTVSSATLSTMMSSADSLTTAATSASIHHAAQSMRFKTSHAGSPALPPSPEQKAGSSPSTSYDSPPALTADTRLYVQRYLEEQRRQNAACIAATPTRAPPLSVPSTTPTSQRVIRRLPARAANAGFVEGQVVFTPPRSASEALGPNWGLPPAY